MIIFDTAAGKGIDIIHAENFADAEKKFKESCIELRWISTGIYQITRLSKSQDCQNDKKDEMVESSKSFKEHDIVVLTMNVDGIPKGTKGTIVFDYGSSGMYEVEFFNDTRTIGTIRVFKGDLKMWE